ncbi:hypothetical protein C0993_011073 [Termitomyces sp. T159_Od127]|nr:hypothetical protein C0993_011073 [Termitomyces sp. T159_Od127]
MPSPTRLPATSSSPSASHFQLQPLHSPTNFLSSTHAGGIQPSSLFFHPARPAQQQQYSPQPSLHNEEPDARNNYPLTPLYTSTHTHSQGQEGHSFEHTLDQDTKHETKVDSLSNHYSSKRSKQSHEPLLPVVGPSHTRRPSVTSKRPTSPAKSTAGRVRTSLDRVFGLSFTNRLSIDSLRNRDNFASDEETATPTRSYHHHDSPARFYNGRTPRAPSMRSHSPAPSHSSSSAGRASPTRAPSFIATPPTPSPYPLSHTPRFKPSSSKPVRNYTLHPSRNHFFLSGRLLTGGDTPFAFIASLSLTIGLAGLWFGTTCVFWWHHSDGGKAMVVVGAYLVALVLSTMLTTATADPGILPRGLDPDPPYQTTNLSDGGLRAPVPMPRDLKVRTDIVRVKYCPTCQLYRPPRSSHCKMCDNCVDGCDHHCQWVNNCIGRRNYTSFFALLCATTITLILIVITTAIHLWLLTTTPNRSGQTLDFRHALGDRKGVGSAVAFCLSMLVIWPVGALLTYHARLLLLNVTTIEMIRNQAHKTVALPDTPKLSNPFSHGAWRRNVAAILCRPRGYSWLQAHAVAVEDLREVNPAMRGRSEV